MSDCSQGSLFIIAAPSGGGKTSLVNALLKGDPRLVLSVSHTTRAARPREVDGQHYHFVSEADFQKMVKNGDFMEHARVFDHYYGTNRNSVASQLRHGQDVILEIDWQGARQVRESMPDCVTIFILPPSLAELERRLRNRRTDRPEVIERRLKDARSDMTHWKEFDYVIINDDLDDAISSLEAVLSGEGEASSTRHPELRNKIQQIVG